MEYCSADSCTSIARATGLCNKHYQVKRNHGDPNYKRPVRVKPKPAPSKRTGIPTIRQLHESEYVSWCAMRHRCYDPKDKRYDRYGGRGIRVYDKWLYSFDYFLEDMGAKPTPLHTLDRVNNDGNYEPSNCVWATVREQNMHRSNSSEQSGVFYIPQKDKWASMLKIGKKLVHNKSYPTRAEALAARKEAELKYL